MLSKGSHIELDDLFIRVVDNGILSMEMKPTTELTATHVQLMYDVVNEKRNGQIFRSVLILHPTTTLGPNVHLVGSEPKYFDYTEALAIVVHSLAHRIIGNFYVKINRQNVPTKLFRDMDSALEWLKSQ